MQKAQPKTASKPAVAATPAAHPVATVDNQSHLPDYLRNTGPARGAENVKADDLVIPRLELVQSLSPCLDETNKSAYIEGAKAGMLFNNVTRELFDDEVEVIPVYFKKEFIIWKDRKKGGGFVESFTTMEAAEAARTGLKDADDHRTNDTANMFCLMRNPNSGRLEEIVVSMAVTKLKVSRTWNSLIRLAGGDSFSRAYTIGTFVDMNKQNEKFNNLTVKPAGFPTEPEYRRAEALYLQIASGQVKVNRDGEDDVSTATAGPTEY